MQTQTGTLALAGTTFFYEIAGSGPAVVLLHAGIADSRMWDAQFQALAADFQVLRYDLRGYGRTLMVEGDFSHRHDLLHVINALHLTQVALVGCSMSGEICIDFTLAHPDRVWSLVPVASGVSGYDDDRPPPPQREALVAAYKAGDLDAVAEYEVQIWVDGPQRRPDQVDPAIRALVHAMDLIPLAIPDDLGNELPVDPPALGCLQQIDCPTLVVIGTLDQPRVVAQCRLIAQQIPQAEAIDLETAHLPNMEQPAQFTQEVLAFLKRAWQKRG